MTDPNWCHQPVITQLMITHWPLPMQWFMDYFNTVFALFICEIGCNARFYLTLPITYLIVFSMQKRRRRPDLLTSSILRLIEHLILGGMLIFWLRRPKPICFGLIKFLRILFDKSTKSKKVWGILFSSLEVLSGTADARWSLFSLKSQTLGHGQTNWAQNFWGIWGSFGQFISTHFGTVSPLSMFSINQPFLQK